jgi:DnaJ domain/Putative peptidoglycan binding domain
MSEIDPKGYYACLGVKPWATAAEIRAAYHRCAKQYHPDVDRRPEANDRFQAITEAYRILRNPLERAIYDNSARAPAGPQSYSLRLTPFLVRVAELAIFSLALGNRRVATLLFLGVLGLTAVLVTELPRGEDETPSALPQPPAAALSLESRRPSEDVASTSDKVLRVAESARIPHPPAPIPPGIPKNQASPVSGAWLLRDLAYQKPPMNLLPREEAQQIQRQLIERGYLLGPADGIWGPRSQAALEDFRRAQGLASEEGWTSEKRTATASHTEEATGLPAERAVAAEHAFPIDRPSELSHPVGAQEPNDSTDEIADVTPEPRASNQVQQVGAGEQAYIGAWARSRAACAGTQAPPLAISAQGASSFGGLAGECDFEQVRREGDGWRTRARCFADGKRWTANVHLRATASTLIWSSERGRATYYRCS